MKVDFKDVVKLYKLYVEIFEEEDGFPVDGRKVAALNRQVEKILNKISADAEMRRKIWEIIGRWAWDIEDLTYKTICNQIRELGIEVIGADK